MFTKFNQFLIIAFKDLFKIWVIWLVVKNYSLETFSTIFKYFSLTKRQTFISANKIDDDLKI